jgi:hypothetical protein
MKAVTIKATGEIETIEFTTENSYRTLSDSVGGLIEPVYLAENLTLWVNEEGKVYGQAVNPIATAIFQSVFGEIDIMVGDVILTGGYDDEGETLGMTIEQIEEVSTMFAYETH